MRIKLKNAWFTPDATLLEPGEHTVPDSYEDLLPPSAEPLDEPEAPKKVEAPKK